MDRCETTLYAARWVRERLLERLEHLQHSERSQLEEGTTGTRRTTTTTKHGRPLMNVKGRERKTKCTCVLQLIGFFAPSVQHSR